MSDSRRASSSACLYSSSTNRDRCSSIALRCFLAEDVADADPEPACDTESVGATESRSGLVDGTELGCVPSLIGIIGEVSPGKETNSGVWSNASLRTTASLAVIVATVIHCLRLITCSVSCRCRDTADNL